MKLTEKELNKFPIGTKIYSNGIMYLKLDINDFSRDGWNYTNKEMMEEDVYKVEIPTYTEYIPPKPILDDKEKEYLSNVIKPFRNQVKFVRKRDTPDGAFEYISIVGKKSKDSFALPEFKSGAMYKGMKLNKEYTVKQLGL